MDRRGTEVGMMADRRRRLADQHIIGREAPVGAINAKASGMRCLGGSRSTISTFSPNRCECGAKIDRP